MAFELFDLGSSIIDIVLARRFFVPFAIGIGAAVGVYYLAGQDPVTAAMAVAIGVAGFCAGLVFHFGGGKSGA